MNDDSHSPDAPDADLRRFLDAQHGSYETALAELAAGRKRSHWMWFVFPQVVGLGHSAMDQRYAIRSLAEARAYLDHPILGARLKECAQQLLRLRGRSAVEVFGTPDDLKLRSSMTLFDTVSEAVAEPRSVFCQVLDKYFDGVPDAMTTDILRAWPGRKTGT